MKNSELYNRTVNILVDAYFNDTLEHGNPCACAVGNIIAANMGKKINVVNPNFASKLGWDGEQIDAAYWYSCINDAEHLLGPKTVAEINSSGYSVDEIIRIENAFESARFFGRRQDDEIMFQGLTNVIEVLDQIHENTDEALTSDTKKRFDKSLAVYR